MGGKAERGTEASCVLLAQLPEPLFPLLRGLEHLKLSLEDVENIVGMEHGQLEVEAILFHALLRVKIKKIKVPCLQGADLAGVGLDDDVFLGPHPPLWRHLAICKPHNVFDRMVLDSKEWVGLSYYFHNE